MKFFNLLLIMLFSFFIFSCETEHVKQPGISKTESEILDIQAINKEDVVPPGERNRAAHDIQAINKEDVVPPGERKSK